METLLELPPRHALSLIDPSMTNGLMSYAGAQQTAPVSQGASGAPPTPAFDGVLNDAVSQAHASAANGDGALAQNVSSPGSTSYATAP